MKQGVACGRFLGFAFGTAPAVGLFPRTIIGVSTLSAHKSIFPLDSCKEFQACIFGVEAQT